MGLALMGAGENAFTDLVCVLGRECVCVCVTEKRLTGVRAR